MVIIIMTMRMRSMVKINCVNYFSINLGEGSFDDGWNVCTKEQVSRLQILSFHLNCSLLANI